MLLLVAGGCSSGLAGKSAAADATPVAEEIRRLKAHVVELERRAAMVEVEVKRLQKRLAELDAGTGTATAAAGDVAAAAANRNRPAPAPRTEAAAPSAAADLGVEVTDLTADSVPATPASEASAEADTRPEDGLSASAQALYDRGYTLFHQGRFVDSETAFQQFLQRFSDTVLGDNAQFWIAEARYARGDLSGALAAFRETVARFPDGNKVPDAALKIG
ncbi:MAG: tetratricopeptide repeat protein, partial [Acidobacteriota bacterium]|nr:tetratricopeptide repeat protein [Acidobacteriota bacterium]